MTSIRPSPLLLKKLMFIQRHSTKVQVSPTTVSSEYIHIQLPRFCDLNIGINTADLIDLVKHAGRVEVENDSLKCEYTLKIGENKLLVNRVINLHHLEFRVDVPRPLVSVKLNGFKCLSRDSLKLRIYDNKLVLESHGLIKTRLCTRVERIEGTGPFDCTVLSKDIKILGELENDIILCCFQDCLVAYGIESEATTAVIIKMSSLI